MSQGSSKRLAAREFAETWQGRGDEKQDTQRFWISLLSDVLGISKASSYIEFEKRVKLGNVSFIDGYIPARQVLIEQKGIDIDLDKAYQQSDGQVLTPYQQARRYAGFLPYDIQVRWICVCNFKEFRVYDMKRPDDAPEIIKLADLEKEYHRLNFLIEDEDAVLKREMEISFQAGSIIGDIYEALLKAYIDPTAPHSLKSLNALCVRLVFCLYAEDTELFGNRLAFHDYLRKHRQDARRALQDLFKVLDTPLDKRDPYLDDDLAAFPYVNGGLFADENIEIPRLSVTVTELILKRASEDFDWSGISPTIFGALFESTLNPVTRRAGGMHYTSIENIHKVIDPLFLDDLKNELAEIKATANKSVRTRQLKAFQNKLASLVILDPASGSGNFLTESYMSLRRLENEAVRELKGDQILLGLEEFDPIKVSISQFYGIEINDFAVTVARTALWIAEHQMMKETENIIGSTLDLLPLTTSARITEGNALRLDWSDIVPREKLSYIIGNPPFVGARLMTKEQKSDLFDVFAGWKNAGELDYVAGWYKKTSDFMDNASFRAALVATNSLAQGEAVSTLWKPLFQTGVKIDFAHRTFRWDSEAKIKAHVHCVIVGFSKQNLAKDKFIFDGDSCYVAEHINAYLAEAEDIFIESRNNPLCNDTPSIGIGNKPIDDGNYLFTFEEMQNFIRKEPASQKYFHKWYGSRELINNAPRWCLWLGECSPKELRSMPECVKRVEAVRAFRLNSKSSVTIKLADKPARFHVENMPSDNYIVLPKVSSERRFYIPIGFMTPDILCSDLLFIVSGAYLYHFGILTSSAHMGWMRAVAGRLEMRYRYSKDIVYNNFPWPTPTDAQKEKIAATAQAILDARALYPDSSLADLYDDTVMPPELRRAHQANDKAVLEAYGLKANLTEAEIVQHLFKLYTEMTSAENAAPATAVSKKRKPSRQPATPAATPEAPSALAPELLAAESKTAYK